MTETPARRLQAVRERVEQACDRAGRPRGAVRLVAVSKRHPAQAVLDLAACGQTVFGENQVQEAARKIPEVGERWEGDRLEWRLVGHLQRNKARQAVALFSTVDSVDSFRLLNTLNGEAERAGRRLPVLLQFNCSGEPQKSGFALEAVSQVAERVPGYAHLHVQGLMTVARLADDPREARKDFASLAKVKDDLQRAWGTPLNELSMGMSHDFEIAIEEGATLIRVGTALFGPREN